MSPWRRVVFAVTAAVALIMALFGSASAQTTRPAPREALVERAAEALARGDATSALRDYEAAAAQEHAADIEIGIVRSLMLAGHYRRALAFAAHAAQAHPGEAEGARVYAQLLDVGGHSALAGRMRPADAALTALTAPGATVLATGVLIDAGRHALLPLRALREVTTATAIELRDGHGRALPAQLVQRNDALGLALLRVHAPLADPPRLVWAARDAFAGSPAHAVTGITDELPWPRLRSGFVGTQGLGIDLAGAARGGAVFDIAGRVIGVSLAGDEGVDRLVTAGMLRRWLGEKLGEGAEAPSQPMPLDAIYETALRATVLLRATTPS